MVLVDRQIKSRVDKDCLIDSYKESCLTNIGYDLRVKNFYASSEDQKGLKQITLLPNESVFVESVETITMPNDLLAQIVLKNSRIRLGLSLDSPVYQPGHKTRIYFRLTNVSASEISLSEDEQYATIIFERLDSEPDHPYAGTFSDEFNFRGLGEYKSAYNKQLRALEKKEDDIKSLENTIYTNVLTILSVFVALFSFLTTNIALTANSATIKEYFVFNALLLGCVSFLVALLNTFVKGKKSSWSQWVPAALAFIVAFVIFLKF